MSNLRQCLATIQQKIAATCKSHQRSPEEITLVAASKAQDAATVRAAFAAGLRHFGENYYQELQAKQAVLADLDVTWHFIGQLQSRKAKAVANRCQWVHSVDSARLATLLHQHRDPARGALQVCIQVNISDEESKAGVLATEVPALAEHIATLPQLRLRGLMALPAPGEAGQAFHAMRALYDSLSKCYALDTLSIGMSGDFEQAIVNGATMVRLGTALFGARTT